MKLKQRLIVGAVFLCFLQQAHASVKIIVHPSNVATLSDAEIKNIFLGKLTYYPDGDDTLPIVAKDRRALSKFLTAAVGKSESQWRAYWAQAQFTGTGTPPRAIDSENIIKVVSQNVDAIAFTTSEDIPDTVRVLKIY